VEVRRGDLVLVSLPGHYGKPRPALVIQSDFFLEHASVTILPLTSEIREAPLLRATVEPDSGNGLRAPSQVMIDKTSTIARAKVQPAFGRIDDGFMLQVERLLALFLGIAK
jgi:mRNA interferase MazF